MEIPKSNNPEEKEPKIKYFKPDSVENVESFFAAAKTYKHKLCNSMAKYKEIRSKELTNNIKPKTAHNNKIKYSKLLIFCLNSESSKIAMQTIEKNKIKPFEYVVNTSKIKVLL